MKMGIYTFASLAFIGLVAGFVYTQASGNYLLEVAGINLNFPIALWMVLPALVLLVLTLCHMLYNGARGYFMRRKWQKDARTMQEAMYWSVLGEPRESKYVVPVISESASLLSSSVLETVNMPKGVSEKLTKAVELVEKIKSGEYIDLKKLKIESRLSPDNHILIQNQINKLQSDKQFFDVVLRDQERYAVPVVDAAFQSALQTQTFFKLMQYADKFTFDDIVVMLDRSENGEDVGYTLDTLKSLMANKKFDCGQYMYLVSSAIDTFDPDENIAFFKELADKVSDAEAA